MKPIPSQNIRYPLVRLPSKMQVTLYLIREELKSRKLFQTLHAIGVETCYFQTHLDMLILHNLGLDDSTDETFNRYHAIMKKRSRKIVADPDSIMKQALKVYHELLYEKKRFSKKDKLSTLTHGTTATANSSAGV